MSTICETVARLGELAKRSLAISVHPGWWMWDSDYLTAANPAVILTLVKQVEWAATIIRTGFNCDEGCQCAARQWIAALDKEME